MFICLASSNWMMEKGKYFRLGETLPLKFFEDNILMEKQILNNKTFLVDYLKNKNISNTFGQILFRLLSAKEFIKIYG